MKTKEILDKYKTTIGLLLNCKPEQLKLYSQVEIVTIENKQERKTTQWVEIGEIYENKIDLDYDDRCTTTLNFQVGYFKFTLNDGKNERQISTWRLYQMPHCCAYIVSCNVTVESRFRNKRVGTVLNQLRQDIGRLLGYSAILCTDVKQNKYQRKLLKNNGWKDIHEIKNKRTSNTVYLSVIDL